METKDAAPCPECRELIDLEARVCPRCMNSLAVDVVLQGSLSDPRRRYGIAKAISALGGGRPGVPAIQARLLSGRGAVLDTVSRAVAARAAEALRNEGVASSIVASGTPQPSSEGRATRWGLWLGLGALLVVAGVVSSLVVGRAGPRPATATASAPAPALAALSPTEVAARGLAATVVLKCGQQSGSGFFVTRDLLLTNAHVLCTGETSISVRFSDGREVQGEVRGSDEALDLAVVQAVGFSGQPLPLGDAGALEVGERLTMIGSPLGLEFSVHGCGVSSLQRQDVGVAYVQIDAAVNPGNSGGPLLDDRGRVVGVVTLKVTSGEGIGLAVPINYAYGGPAPLVPGHGGPDTPGFAAMRARADAVSQRAADELAATGQLPGLVGGVVRGDTIIVHIVWPSTSSPAQSSFRFSLVKGETSLCSMDGEVARWEKLERADHSSVLDPRVKSWLERNGFASDLYGGSAVLDWSGCAATEIDGAVDLELEGADSDASRIRFTPR